MKVSSIQPVVLLAATASEPDNNVGNHFIARAGEAITARSIVFANSASKNTMRVKKAGASVALSSTAALYIAMDSQSVVGEYIRISDYAVLGGVDTSAGTEGAPVWLSATAGSWTLTRPTGVPARQIGVVLAVSATLGQIALNPSAYSTSVVEVGSSVAASTAITGTQEAETMFSTKQTIPANRLRAGSTVHVVAQGIHTSTTGTETHTMLLKLGTVTIAQKTLIDPANNDVFFFDFWITIRTDGVSGTAVAAGHAAFGGVGAAAPAVYSLGSTTVNTTIDLDVGVAIDRQTTATDGDSARLDLLAVVIYN